MATSDLVKRSGAIEFKLGYLRDHVPVEQQGWFAAARYEGDKEVKAEGLNPVDACNGLAIKLLDGAICRRCARPVTVFGNDNAFCGWHMEGQQWVSGCGMPIDYSIPLGPRVAA